MSKDNEAIYDGQINPLMAKIIEICQEQDIPMFASFRITDEPSYCTTYLPSGADDDFLSRCRNQVPRAQIAAFTITKEPSTKEGEEG